MKKLDTITEATFARNVLTRFEGAEKPSAKASAAQKALIKAMDKAAEEIKTRREALQSAMR
jgi:hypothetical protein